MSYSVDGCHTVGAAQRRIFSTLIRRPTAWFYVAARSGEIGGTVGTLLGLGVLAPILVQALGWTVFGTATYRARVFPRWLALGLVVGTLLLVVPVQGSPVVFQLAIASMGLLLFTGRTERPSPEGETKQAPSESVGG